MCNKCRFLCLGRSTSIIIAAVYTLLQSIVFFLVGLAAVSVNKCSLTMEENRYVYAMYLTYLRNPECGDVDLRKLGIEMDPQLPPPEFSLEATPAINRTILFSWLYVGFNGFWILASFMLIIGGIRSCSGRCGHYFFWQPWIWATLGNIVLDIVAVIFFGIDLQNAKTIEEFMEWIGLENFGVVIPYIPQTIQNARTLPSIIMIFLTARLVIIEVFNIFFLLMVMFIWFEILGEFVSGPKPSRPYSLAYEEEQSRVNPAFEPDLPNNIKPEAPRSQEINLNTQKVENGQRNRLNRNLSAYENPNFEQVVDEDVERRLQKFQEITPGKNPPGQNRYTKNQAGSRAQSVEKNRVQKSPPKEPRPDYGVSEPTTPIPAPDYDSDDDIQPRRNEVIRTGSHVQAMKQTFEAANADRAPRIVERERSKSPEANVQRSSSFMNQPELRNQLPWSYFKGEDSGPKKFFVHPITGERVARSFHEAEPVPEASNESDEAKSRF